MPTPYLTTPNPIPACHTRPYYSLPYLAGPHQTEPDPALATGLLHKRMPLLMAIMARGFEIGRVVSSTLGEF